MMVSHIVLRKREPDLHRPYRTPGGIVTTSVALVLAAAAVVATFFVDEKAAGITALIFVAALAYFWFYSRHHLVASAPEEEFAAIGTGGGRARRRLGGSAARRLGGERLGRGRGGGRRRGRRAGGRGAARRRRRLPAGAQRQRLRGDRGPAAAGDPARGGAAGERLPAGRELAARLGRQPGDPARGARHAAVRRLPRGASRALRRDVRARPAAPLAVGAGPAADERVLAELDDVLLLRQALEAGAAESAAGRSLSRAEREHLTGRLAACSAAALHDYRRLDSRLHLAVAELAGSPSLTATLTDVRSRLNELLESMPLMPPNLEHSNHQHAAVVSAVLAGDPAEARRAMTEHLAGTEALLRGFLA
jgi:DNA-binding FadR family transcriptional regulator